jgi:AcrR family transcriptional regulator
MGLYSRFEGKSGVVDALFRSGFKELEASIRSSHQIPDPLEAFVSCGKNYRALGIAHPARYQVMFMCAVPGFVPSDESHLAAAAAFGALAGTVQRCLDAGVFRQGDPVQLAQQVWASCHGWVTLELLGITFVEDLEGGYAKLMEMLAVGLLAP